MRGRLPLAFLVAAAAIAGCIDEEVPHGTPPPDPGHEVPAANLTAGGFFAFGHAGGSVALRASEGSHAVVDLFDGEDLHLGRFTLEGDGASLVLGGVAGPDPVLHVVELNGTLEVESDGDAVTGFTGLPLHAERHVILEGNGLAVGVAFPGTAASQDLEVNLTRPPVFLRVLATGSYQGVRVEARSGAGTVASAQGDSPFPDPVSAVLGSGRFEEVPGTFFPANVSDGRLRVHAEAAALADVLLLESWSYSRASVPPAAPATLRPITGGFTYGALPGQPTAFEVHPAARHMTFQALPSDNGTVDLESGEFDFAPARVALHDPDGRPVARLEVPVGWEAAVAVEEGGTYVAYALAGNVLLGADRAPADFEMRPLQVIEDTYPHTRPGGNPRTTSYGQAGEEVSGPGVPYALRAGTTSGGFAPFPTPVPCAEDGLLRLSRGNETIGLQWDEADPWPVAALYLDGGPLEVWHDGFGFDGCLHRAVTLSFYVAPTG